MLFQCVYLNFILYVCYKMIDIKQHVQQDWLHLIFILAWLLVCSSNHGVYIGVQFYASCMYIIFLCFVNPNPKIKEALCAGVCGVSDHGQRRVQHHSHPRCDGSSH